MTKNTTDKEVQKIIARLRASKNEDLQLRWGQGNDAGWSWGRRRAKYVELVRASEADQYEFTDCEGALSTFIEVLNPYGEHTNEKVFESAFGDDYDELSKDEVFVGGFLAGATEFFERMKDKI